MQKDRSNRYTRYLDILMSKKLMGTAVELKVLSILQNHGFIVFHHPHSATPDLMAWRNGVLYLIEVKSTHKDSLVINPDQVECIKSMLQFFANTSIPAVGFVVVYFIPYDAFGVKKVDPLEDSGLFVVRVGEHAPDLPL